MLQTTCAVQAGTSGGAVVQRCSGELLGKDVLQEESHVHLLNRGGHMITTENVSVQGKVSCAYNSGSVSTAVFAVLNSQKMFLCCVAGIVSSNTRDMATKVTYPHLNFSVPVTVFQRLLQHFEQTKDVNVFRELDSTEKEIRRVWRLQGAQSKL